MVKAKWNEQTVADMRRGLRIRQSPTARDVRDIARTLDCTVTIKRDRDEQNHEVLIDPPDGYVFAGSGVHQLVCCGSDGTPLVELYRDAIERMADGVTRCEDPDCDIC